MAPLERVIGLSYDFAGIGLDGLSTFTNYADGDTPETGSAASPDRQEWDITLDYRPPFQPLDNLWIRLRRGEVWEDGPNGNGLVDYRVIVNYRFRIL